MEKPQSYTEWLVNAGNIDTFGSSMLLTHSLLRRAHRDVIRDCFKPVEDGFEKALFDNGAKPIHIELFKENDQESRATRINSVIETYQGASLEDYAGRIFADAQNFYNQVKVWENKSLWQYIKYWFKRKV